MEYSESPYLIPITLDQANSFIKEYRERYHPYQGRGFAIGCAQDGKLTGAVIVGRPLAQTLDEQTAVVNYIYTIGGRTAYGMLYGVNANLKMSIFAETECNFSPVSTGVHTALIHNSTCRFEARQALIYQLALGLTGENGKYNYSRAVHVYPPFFDIPCSAKNYKIAPALTPNGTRSYSYVHVTGDTSKKRAFLTEGPLKGDVASYLAHDALFVCVGGVNAIHGLKDTLVELGVTQVVETMDMDQMTNPNVRKAIQAMRKEVQTIKGLKYTKYTWDPAYKGVDDYLLSRVAAM